MGKSGLKTVLRIGAVAAAVTMLGACATSEELDSRFAALESRLESKINEALRNSASAKIDATTALSVAMEKK